MFIGNTLTSPLVRSARHGNERAAQANKRPFISMLKLRAKARRLQRRESFSSLGEGEPVVTKEEIERAAAALAVPFWIEVRNGDQIPSMKILHVNQLHLWCIADGDRRRILLADVRALNQALHAGSGGPVEPFNPSLKSADL
jgi:hypothetical protein